MATIDELMAGDQPDGEETPLEGQEGASDPVRKEVANYRPAEQDSMEACENCQHFIAPEGCSRVLGKISASGVCDLFEPAESEELLDSGLDEFLFSGTGGGGGLGPGMPGGGLM